MRSSGEETGRSTLTLTALYPMLDHAYTDLYTCEEVHGDPGQSTRNAAADPPLRADHLALHGAAADPGPVHAADAARPRDLSGQLRINDPSTQHSLRRCVSFHRHDRRTLRAP